jgi:hypothetical protein
MGLTDYNTQILPILEKIQYDSKVEILDIVLQYLEQVDKQIIDITTCTQIIKALQNHYKEISKNEN